MNGACSICHRVLDWETKPDGTDGHWVHTAQDRRKQDHEPVWAPEDATTQYRCDFCNVNPPIFELPCADFEIPLVSGNHSVGEWMCCGLCAPMVSSADWDALLSRVMKVSPSFAGSTFDRAHARVFLTVLYREIASRQLGPLQPWTPPQ